MFEFFIMILGWALFTSPFVWLALKEVEEEEKKRQRFLAFLRRFRESYEKQKSGK